MKDLNDMAKDGTLPRDVIVGSKPVNAKALDKDASRPARVYTVKEILEESQVRAHSKLDRTGIIATTHYELDKWTGGMRPGFTWVIAADTSTGKSAYAIAVADDAIRDGKRVLIVSAEDDRSIYADRLLARRAKIDALRLRDRCSTRDELERIDDVIRKAEDCPVYIEAGVQPIERLEKELRAVIRWEKIDVIFFDYLQEFESSKRHQDERLKFKHIAKVMRELIKSEGKTGAILSQLTPSEAKVPTKHQIRECKDVANGAEVICILFKPSADIMGPDPGVDEFGTRLQPEKLFEAGKRYALLDKVKQGIPGKKVFLPWNEASACFESVTDPELERLKQFYPEDEQDGF